jgi:hypothetical protein
VATCFRNDRIQEFSPAVNVCKQATGLTSEERGQETGQSRKGRERREGDQRLGLRSVAKVPKMRKWQGRDQKPTKKVENRLKMRRLKRRRHKRRRRIYSAAKRSAEHCLESRYRRPEFAEQSLKSSELAPRQLSKGSGSSSKCAGLVGGV